MPTEPPNIPHYRQHGAKNGRYNWHAEFHIKLEFGSQIYKTKASLFQFLYMTLKVLVKAAYRLPKAANGGNKHLGEYFEELQANKTEAKIYTH